MSSLSSPALVADDAPSTRRALVIDDSRAQRSMLRRLLADRGYEVNERSEEHTSELQSLMRTSYAVFCLKKKNKTKSLLHMLRPPPTRTTLMNSLTNKHITT